MATLPTLAGPDTGGPTPTGQAAAGPAARHRTAVLQLRGAAGPLRARVLWPGPDPGGDPGGGGGTAATGALPPLLVFFAGAGAGGPGSGEARCRQLCAQLGVVVVSPEAAGLPDAATLTWWVADHATELGADPGRLLVGGEGAGGRLAVEVARLARDQGWPPIRRQLLIAPRLDIGGNRSRAGAGPPGPAGDVIAGFERFRPELARYCARLLGSAFDADDAMQETLVRAWRGYARFEGRSSLRVWLYRIARNVCLDMLMRGRRQPEPVDHAAAAEPPAPADDDPARRAAARDEARLAVMALLLHLPPRQRAVLVLREVLRWQAAEVAELLGTSVASVNSSLQRARANLAAGGAASDCTPLAGLAQRALADRCVDAVGRHDVRALVSLLG